MDFWVHVWLRGIESCCGERRSRGESGLPRAGWQPAVPGLGDENGLPHAGWQPAVPGLGPPAASRLLIFQAWDRRLLAGLDAGEPSTIRRADRKERIGTLAKSIATVVAGSWTITRLSSDIRPRW